MSGWAREFDRAPGDDDLVDPALTGAPRSNKKMLEQFHGDLDLLGLRRRRAYDLRRTFITLARADGADRDTRSARGSGGANLAQLR